MSSNDRNAADLFVECLEAEDVEYVFGIPGEETLELNRALDASPIAVTRFIAPGPSVPRQTPARPVSRPYMSAM